MNGEGDIGTYLVMEHLISKRTRSIIRVPGTLVHEKTVLRDALSWTGKDTRNRTHPIGPMSDSTNGDDSRNSYWLYRVYQSRGQWRYLRSSMGYW